MKKLIYICLVTAITWACDSSQTTSDKTETTVKVEEDVKKEEEKTTTEFGDPTLVKLEEAKTVDMLSSDMAEADSVGDIQIKGKVTAVCQKKGCWINLEKENGETVRVKFKDYAFFMPKDLAGKEVALHGYALKKITPVAELQHLAEDAGKSKEEIAQITEAKEEIAIKADGVIILE